MPDAHCSKLLKLRVVCGLALSVLHSFVASARWRAVVTAHKSWKPDPYPRVFFVREIQFHSVFGPLTLRSDLTTRCVNRRGTVIAQDAVIH
jgi:hypothetical protein